MLTGSETRIFAFHVCHAVILVKIYFISSWIHAGKFRAFDSSQIFALKFVLLPVKGSIAFHGHHFVHLKDKICFQHVLKSFSFAQFCAVHFILLLTNWPFYEWKLIVLARVLVTYDCRSSAVHRSGEFMALSEGETSQVCTCRITTDNQHVSVSQILQLCLFVVVTKGTYLD